MRRFFPAWAALTTLLFRDAMVLEEVGSTVVCAQNSGCTENFEEMEMKSWVCVQGEEIQLQLINFNFEMMQVTWNASEYSGTNLTFSYKLSEDEVYCQCPNYILHQHHRVGCLLEAGDDVLDFSILNGTHPLLSRTLWTSTYLKPSSPKDVTFLWDNETVTVACSDLTYDGLLYEIQYRSNFDTEWQPKEEETCNVTIEGLDDDKCYYFRARVKTKESSYGSHTYPSDWSEVMHWQRGQLKDFCPQEKKPFPKYILISSLVALLTLSLLLLFLWKLQRVKKLLMPSVPDPKYTFPGLFEDHRGNFQEWITDTQNVSSLNKMEGKEKECVLEDVLVAQLVKAEVDKPTIGQLSMQTGEEEAGSSDQLPHHPPQGGDVVSLGGFRFVMNDNAYMML